MKYDTIVAIATAMSDSGIGIIRLSGNRSIEIVNQLFKTKNNKKLVDCKSHTINYGFFVENENIIDEVMVSVMKHPNSYTTEDVVEINCHGGVLMVSKILEIVIKYGARLAEPGEFTKRAFLNGRIDLSKAEAIIDIIHSKNEFALQSSVNQLKGVVADTVINIRNSILYEIAYIESALDDPEHVDLEGYPVKLKDNVLDLKIKIKNLIDNSNNGRILKEGITTVILGKPNAGKSSLLNILIGEERAIVTNIAGTTRDILEQYITIDGIGLNIIDTAGIRSTNDIVEKIGVDKAKEYAKKADLVIYVIDVSESLTDEDIHIINMIEDKNIIILRNKADLDSKVCISDIIALLNVDKVNRYKIKSENEHITFIDDEKNKKRNIRIINTSTKEKEGIHSLVTEIKNMFYKGKIHFNDEVIITNMRHKEALLESYDSLNLVLKSLENSMPEDFYSIDLMNAYISLGKIIGEEIGEDLVNEIFSKFCTGK